MSLKHKAYNRVLRLTFFVLWVQSAVVQGEESQSWDFSVYLDDKPIGHHRFEMSTTGQETIVESHARFKVKMLFVTVFNYKHNNRETWENGCLTDIVSDTQSNRKRYRVTGSSGPRGLVLETQDGQVVLDSCTMSFAYWDPSFLKQKTLLNSQTGRMMDIQVSTVHEVSEQSSLTEYRYRVEGEKLDLEVIYTPDYRWVGLETIVRGNKRLRYVLD